jgi:hypothetical protein
MKPSLYLPGGFPLVIVALLTAFSTILSCGHWPRFMVSSAVGTFVGLWTGWAIWKPIHSIAASYVLLGIGVATLAALLVSLTVGLAVRKVSLSNERWRVPFWISLACCLAMGPIALALTPSLIARRVSRNERVAAERFQSPKSARRANQSRNRQSKESLRRLGFEASLFRAAFQWRRLGPYEWKLRDRGRLLLRNLVPG